MSDRSTSSQSSATTLKSIDSSRVTPNFKVILTGEVGVGKTTMFSKLRHHNHVLADATSSSATIGVDSCSRIFHTRFGNVTLTVWDTAGVERFRTLTRNYYRNTHAALLIFSLDDPATLFYLPRWQRDVIDSAPSASLYLLGNKSDLERQVTDSAMQSFAGSHNCQSAFLTSARTGEGLEAALTAVCEDLVSKHHRHADLYDHDQLWMEGSGLHVHGSGEHDVTPVSCSFRSELSSHIVRFFEVGQFRMEHHWTLISAFLLLVFVQASVSSDLTVLTEDRGNTWVTLEILQNNPGHGPEVIKYKITVGTGRDQQTRLIRSSRVEGKGTMVTITDLGPSKVRVIVVAVYSNGRKGTPVVLHVQTVMDDDVHQKRGGREPMMSSATKPMTCAAIAFMVTTLHAILRTAFA
ncbi:hypothetical protein ACOMHN_011041 [Nucella lapillus]